jgi:hypothetical protein
MESLTPKQIVTGIGLANLVAMSDPIVKIQIPVGNTWPPLERPAMREHSAEWLERKAIRRTRYYRMMSWRIHA